jgi:hypothetical protein
MSTALYANLLIPIGLKMSCIANKKYEIANKGSKEIGKEEYMKQMAIKDDEYMILYRQQIILKEKLRLVCIDWNVSYDYIISSIDKKVDKKILDGLSTNFEINENDQKSINVICMLIK